MSGKKSGRYRIPSPTTGSNIVYHRRAALNNCAPTVKYNTTGNNLQFLYITEAVPLYSA